MLDDKDLVALEFPVGKNNVAKETDLPEGALREALNVDLYKEGNVARRKGYASVYSGTNIHSLFSTKDYTVFCENGTLNTLNAAYVASTVRTGLNATKDISYAQVNKQVYYSNDEQSGIITENATHAEWGVESPSGQPILSSTTGSLSAGRYQVAITFASPSGEESGTQLAAVLDVTEGGGIQLSSIPQSSTAASVRVYVSPPNGDVLYHHVTLPMGITTGVVTSTVEGRALETQFMSTMPPGHIVRHYKGRMWVAIGNMLVFSPALRFGLYDPRHTYFRFSEKITVVQPVQDGIYVVADKAYFLSGSDPKDMEQVVVYDKGGVLNTGASVSPHVFDYKNDVIKSLGVEQTPDEIAFWYSPTGAMLGFPGGRVKAVTEDRLSISEYERGATLFREEDGMRQLITSLTDKSNGSSFVASDTAVAEVIRNGVVLT